MIQTIREKWLHKILFGVVLTILFLVAWQYLAGGLFMLLNGHNFLEATPKTVVRHWLYYSNNSYIHNYLSLCMFGSILVLIAPLVPIFKSKRQKMFGDAHLATAKEIDEAGLFAKDGIIIGKYDSSIWSPSRYLILGGNQHVGLSAPTRGGKGVSLVIPNLLAWKGSVVCLDIKKENWLVTAGFRAKHGQSCYALNFAPRDCRTHRWNPLHYISPDPNFRINDIQKIGQMLFPRLESEAPIWQASSRSLWLGLVLFCIEMEYQVTLGEVLRVIALGDENLAEKIEVRQNSDNPLSDRCYLALKDYLDTPFKTRGSVRKSFISALELFYNPVIDAATSGNDFDLQDLRKKKMSIYVCITPDDLERLSPLINLFFKQVIDINTRTLPEEDKSIRYKCLLLMDEFTSIGKVEILSKGIAYMAQYWLRLVTVVQSPAQIKESYGENTKENFLENTALQVFYTPKNIKIAKEISDEIGTKTIKRSSHTRKSRGFASESINTSDHGRPLFLPQEIKKIPKSKQLVIIEYCNPILSSRIIWYKDKIFKERGNNLLNNSVTWKTPIIPEIIINNETSSSLPQLASHESNTLVEIQNITIDDINNIDNIDLSNFSCDFSNINIPKGHLDKDQINELTEAFFAEINK